jgi:tape measure domain-containing protein
MPGTSGLPLAGVEAIVEGLSAFQGDVHQMNSALESIKPRQTLLQRGFESLTGGIVDFGKGILQWGVDTLASFGQSIMHVAEVALGMLLRDAILAAIGWFKDLASATIEAGNEFQILQIRLNGLNLQDATDSGLDYESAMGAAVEKTKEQMDWLQTLGAATPFDPAQIANIYTLARSYGFADEAAQQLTRNITDYTAGMGLSDEVLERVIQNMGQMIQRGKITSTEIRDLARGAYLPLADVLDRVAKSMGITVAELSKKISEPGGGVPAQEFIDAFNEMVEQEPRFIGAAGRLGRALVPAAKNVKELFTSLGGRNIVTPVFDILGEKIASLTDQFVHFNEQGDLIVTEKWDKIVAAATRIGEELKGIIGDLLGFMPSSETIADNLVNGFNRVADWLTEHREDIVIFFQKARDFINDKLIPKFWEIYNFVKDKLIPKIGEIFTKIKEASGEFQESGFSADFLEKLGFKPETAEKIIGFIDKVKEALARLKEWLDENGPLIDEFFATVGEIVFEFISDLTGGGAEKGDVTGDILDGITRFMQFVIDNKDEILKWVEILWSIFAVWQVLATIWNIAVGILIALAPVILLVVGFLGLLSGVITGPVLIAVGIFIATLAAAILIGKAFGDAIVKALLWIRDNITWIDWRALGVWIVQGIVGGINQFLPGLGDALIGGMIMIYNRLKEWLGIHSPSTLFAELGQSLMEGMAQGVLSGVEALVGAFNHIASIASEKVNHIMSIIGGLSVFGFASGIEESGEVAGRAMEDVAEQVTGQLQAKLHMTSPSKVFEELGALTVAGFAQGIERSAGLAADAMQGVVGAVTVPAMSSVLAARAAGGNTYNDTRTANLTINSSAPIEPIIQDFHLMESLTGA